MAFATLNRNDERQVRDFTIAAIKDAQRDALFGPFSLGEKHDIRVKPKFETACWSYLPPHRIYVGLGIIAKAKPTLSREQLKGYVKSHVRHELAHAHYTERNMRKVRQALKEIEAPFQLFNLFEDARIEDRYRRDAEYAFEWLVYEDLPFSKRPETLLFAIIQAEGDVERVRLHLETADVAAAKAKEQEGLDKRLSECKNPLELVMLTLNIGQLGIGPPVPVELQRAQALEVLERVAEYYERMIDSKLTAGLYPVLADWMEEFGRPESAPSMGCNGEPGEKSDLEIGAELAEDLDFRDEFDADAEEVKSGKDGDGTGSGKAKPSDQDQPIAQRGNVLQSERRASMPDLVRAAKLAERLKKFFSSVARLVNTTNPQRRVSARHFSLDRPYYRVKEVKGKSRQKILLVIDCSGSMGGFHTGEGKVLLAALSRLAKQGYLEGHVLLSAGSPPRWELFELPMADEVIARIAGFAGAEGLEPTLRDNLALAKDADYVFVYTDAQITDAPIDKKALHRYGVFTWGLYAGERGDYHEEMQKYFDKDIMRENAEALVDAMLLQKK